MASFLRKRFGSDKLIETVAGIVNSALVLRFGASLFDLVYPIGIAMHLDRYSVQPGVLQGLRMHTRRDSRKVRVSFFRSIALFGAMLTALPTLVGAAVVTRGRQWFPARRRRSSPPRETGRSRWRGPLRRLTVARQLRATRRRCYPQPSRARLRHFHAPSLASPMERSTPSMWWQKCNWVEREREPLNWHWTERSLCLDTFVNGTQLPPMCQVDTDGNLLVADFYNSRILAFTGPGAPLLAWGPYGPGCVVSDAAGNLFVNDYAGNLKELTTDGAEVTLMTGIVPGSAALTIDDSGNIYVGGAGPNHAQVVKLTPSGTTCKTSGALSCQIAGLTNGDHYTFVVQAENRRGVGQVSAATGYLTPSTVPSAPTSVVATLGDNRVTVNWAAPASTGGSPITNYVVVSSPGDRVCQTSGVRSCAFTSLNLGASYTFSVFATNRNGSSPVSQPSAAVATLAPPTVPQDVTVRGGNAAVVVSWKAPSESGGGPISAYTVTLSPGGGSCTTTQLTCAISGLQNGVAYVATVVATNVAGDSPPSDPGQPVAPTGLPGTVARPTVVRGDGSATVRWTAPNDPGGLAITGYLVTPFYNGVRQSGLTVAASVSSHLVTGLPLGALVTFTVTAVNANGQGAPSQAPLPISAATIPTAPTVPVVTQSVAGQLTIAWTPLENGGDPVTAYVVTSTPAGHGCTTTQATCVISGLALGAQYRFTVVAQNSIGISAKSTTSAPAALAIATSTIASATEVSPTRLYVATPDRQVAVYLRATGALLKAVTLSCAPTSMVVDGTSLWVGCASTRSVMVLNQDLGIVRTVVVPGAITALSLGGANLYVATALSTQLTSINRTTGQVTKIALPVVPLDLRCTATNCTVLTATGGTKIVTFTFATKKITNAVQLPGWATKLFTVGSSIVAFGPGSLTALRIDLPTRNIASLSFGEVVLNVGGSGAVATVVTAHRVTLVNLVPWTKKKTTEFVTAVKATSVDGATVIAGDAASPFVRVVVAA